MNRENPVVPPRYHFVKRLSTVKRICLCDLDDSISQNKELYFVCPNLSKS